jgi:hypothetical protein
MHFLHALNKPLSAKIPHYRREWPGNIEKSWEWPSWGRGYYRVIPIIPNCIKADYIGESLSITGKAIIHDTVHPTKEDTIINIPAAATECHTILLIFRKCDKMLTRVEQKINIRSLLNNNNNNDVH